MTDKNEFLSVVSSTFLLDKYGRPVEQLVRTGTSGCKAFIDYLTFVLNWKTLLKKSNKVLYTELYEQYKDTSKFYTYNECLEKDLQNAVTLISLILSEIFGFGISEEREKGLYFYGKSYQLGTENCNYGYVCIGDSKKAKQNDGLCVVINGTGLLASNVGWEQKLFKFSEFLENDFKYTRIDIARDFFFGEYNIDLMLQDYQDGGFKIKGAMRNPLLNKVGNDWLNDTQDGRTLYIGSRKSSRYLRGYEKGKQLGCKESNWFRVELELHNRDLIIPNDIILRCGDYLTMYPALANNPHFKNVLPKKIENIKRQHDIKISNSIKHMVRQCQKVFNYLLDERKLSDKQIVDLFRVRKNNGIPKDMDIGQYSARALNLTTDYYNQYIYRWCNQIISNKDLVLI